MKLKFEPIDFDPRTGKADDGKDLCSYEWAANKAQAKFDKWLEQQPVIYGRQMIGTFVWANSKELNDTTHSARLVCIEPLEKKECEHEAHEFSMASFKPHIGMPIPEATCSKCGIKLKAKWITLDPRT